MTVQHAAVQGWEGDTAYEAFGLESYIGAKVIVDGEVYGTFCFADSEPRDQPFTEDEETGDPEHFAECRTGLDRMEALIDDFLILAREGKTDQETGPIALADVVRESWSHVPTEDATLTIETDATVEGDRTRVLQLFENLFGNAIEHGGTDVTVTVGDIEGGTGVCVEDDGPGIPGEDHEAVFEEGYSTNEMGTGVGLSIVAQVVDAHGWEITVTEGEAGGARFEITGVSTTGFDHD